MTRQEKLLVDLQKKHLFGKHSSIHSVALSHTSHE